MIDSVYIHVKKEDNVLKVKGLKVHFKDNGGYVFRVEDQDLSKHPLVAADLRSKTIKDYRHVKITGTGLSTYFEPKTVKFVFNGFELKKDTEDFLIFTEEGICLIINHKKRSD